MAATIVFPQYRKYVDVDIWYMITAEDHFTEIKKMGNTYVLVDVEAIQYPEKLRIQDMLNCHEDRWEIIDESLYSEMASFV